MRRLLPLLLLLLPSPTLAQQWLPGSQAQPIACAYNASPPTLITNTAGWVQCDSTGKLLTSGTSSFTWPGTAALTNYGTAPSSGTVPAINAYVTNSPTLSWPGSASPSTYGTPPSGTVPGVNSYVTNTVPVTGTFWQATQPVSIASSITSTGSYFYNTTSSVLTRASDTTAYTANTTVCLLKSTTACAPITIGIASTNAGKGLITRVSLLKSGSTTTNASFTIWLYSAAPTTSTPTQYDNVAYTGPRAADMPNYIGSAVCATPVATSDTSAGVWYDCTLSNPNTAGALVFQSLAGSTNLNALISVNAAYTPVSAETFTAYVSGIY